MKGLWKYILIGLSVLLLALLLAFLYSRSWENALFINPIYKLDADEKVVALTFDDGPSKKRTPPLLELLAEKGVKATFFMLGENIEKQPEIAQNVYEHGHLIGNHSYNHPRLILKSPAYMRDQIERTDHLITSLGQKEVAYFRPPYSYKYIVLPLLLSSMDKFLVTGTYDPPSEYKSPYNGRTVADEVIRNIESGSIIFLHDGINADPLEFVKSVEFIIDELRSQGYKFVRLDYSN